MKGFIIVDKDCGNVEGILSLPDGSEFPKSYPLYPNQTYIAIDKFDERSPQAPGYAHAYDFTAKTFGPKLTVLADADSIAKGTGVSTLTITYPDSGVRETCLLSVDGKDFKVSISNGTGVAKFSSDIPGNHVLVFTSGGKHGKCVYTITVTE